MTQRLLSLCITFKSLSHLEAGLRLISLPVTYKLINIYISLIEAYKFNHTKSGLIRHDSRKTVAQSRKELICSYKKAATGRRVYQSINPIIREDVNNTCRMNTHLESHYPRVDDVYPSPQHSLPNWIQSDSILRTSKL